MATKEEWVNFGKKISAGMQNRRAAKSSKGGVFLIPFGGVFFAAGCFMLWIMVLGPLLGVVKSAGWNEVPCTIAESRIKESSDSDGTQYKPVVRYHYEVEGKSYKGERIDFGMQGSSNMRKTEEAVLRPYPVGKTVKCLVNPHNPSEAVLSRSWGHGLTKWIGIPFGGVFAAVGFGLMMWGVSSVLPKRKPKQNDFGKVVLKPGKQRLVGLGGILFINVFWNGIVSVFLIVWLGGLIEGTADGFMMKWGLGLFLIPFVAIGAVMLWVLWKQIRQLFAPSVEVVLETLEWRSGDSQLVSWSMPVSEKTVSLRVQFVCTEEASYRRGTNTVTDREEVASYDLAAGQSGDGSCRFEVPRGLMPSWAGSNNAIIWGLKVVTEGPGPDAEDEYPITLLPEGGAS